MIQDQKEPEKKEINMFLDSYSNINPDVVDLFSVNEIEKLDVVLNNDNILTDKYLDHIYEINNIDVYNEYLEKINYIYFEFKYCKERLNNIIDDLDKIKEMFKFEINDYELQRKSLTNDMDNLETKYFIKNSNNYFDSLKNDNNKNLISKNKKKLNEKIKILDAKILVSKLNLSKYVNIKSVEIINEEDIKKNINAILEKLYNNFEHNTILYDRTEINKSIKIVKYAKGINIEDKSILKELINIIKDPNLLKKDINTFLNNYYDTNSCNFGGKHKKQNKYRK